jgi:hypothetical protein
LKIFKITIVFTFLEGDSFKNNQEDIILMFKHIFSYKLTLHFNKKFKNHNHNFKTAKMEMKDLNKLLLRHAFKKQILSFTKIILSLNQFNSTNL